MQQETQIGMRGQCGNWIEAARYNVCVRRHESNYTIGDRRTTSQRCWLNGLPKGPCPLWISKANIAHFMSTRPRWDWRRMIASIIQAA